MIADPVKWRGELRTAVISIGIGIFIAGLFGTGRADGSIAEYLVTGAIVGLSIYASNSLVAVLFQPLVRHLSGGSRLAFDIVVYLIGGVSGWVIGFAIANFLLGIRFSIDRIISGPLLIFITITAVLSVTIGLAFRRFEVLTERLRVRVWAERELDLARVLQTRLLPPPSVAGFGFQVEARNVAAHTVAGDLYDVVLLEDGAVFVAVADVAGKGMAAGLIMASVKSALPYVAREGVGAAAAALNLKLCNELERREFVALVCARYDPLTGEAEIVNAGCPEPYIIRSDAVEVISNPGERLPLGIRREITYTPVTVSLAPGDRLLFITDGVPEAPAGGEPLGYDALMKIIACRAPAGGTAAEWLDALLADVNSAVDEKLTDDWTALVVQRTG